MNELVRFLLVIGALVAAAIVAILCAVSCQKRAEVDRFRYAAFDGHEYVIYERGMGDLIRSGMAHSPNCPCRKEGADK